MDENKEDRYDTDTERSIIEIARQIKALRIESGMTQAQLGLRLSVSQDTVSLWENGKSVPTVEYIIALCKLFSVSSDYLLGLSDY